MRPTGEQEPARLRAARRKRAHLLHQHGELIQRIAARCGVSIKVAKQFLREPVLVRTRAEASDLPLGVRMVKGGAFQARPWTGPGRAQNVNLGLFHPETYRSDGIEHRGVAERMAIAAAAFAAAEFRKRMAWNPRPDVLDVLRQLQSEQRRGLPVVPPHVLPPLVRRAMALPAISNRPRELIGYRVWGRPEIYATVEQAWAVAKVDWDAKANQHKTY